MSWLWPKRLGKYGRRCASANLWKSLSLQIAPTGRGWRKLGLQLPLVPVDVLLAARGEGGAASTTRRPPPTGKRGGFRGPCAALRSGLWRRRWSDAGSAGYAPARGGGLARAHALLLGTIRNTGKRGANRSNPTSGASLSWLSAACQRLRLLAAMTRARSREVIVQTIGAAAVEAMIAEATHSFFGHCGYRAAAESFRRAL